MEGGYQCSACDAYSTLDASTGWTDPLTEMLYDVPFCDGVCNSIFEKVPKYYVSDAGGVAPWYPCLLAPDPCCALRLLVAVLRSYGTALHAHRHVRRSRIYRTPSRRALTAPAPDAARACSRPSSTRTQLPSSSTQATPPSPTPASRAETARCDGMQHVPVHMVHMQLRAGRASPVLTLRLPPLPPPIPHFL